MPAFSGFGFCCCTPSPAIDYRRYADSANPSSVEAQNFLEQMMRFMKPHPSNPDLLLMASDGFELGRSECLYLYDAAADAVLWGASTADGSFFDGEGDLTVDRKWFNAVWLPSGNILALRSNRVSSLLGPPLAAWVEAVVLDTSGNIIWAPPDVTTISEVMGATPSAAIVDFLTVCADMVYSPNDGRAYATATLAGAATWPEDGTSGAAHCGMFRLSESSGEWSVDFASGLVIAPGLSNAFRSIRHETNAITVDDEGMLWITGRQASYLHANNPVSGLPSGEAEVFLWRIDPADLFVHDDTVSDPRTLQFVNNSFPQPFELVSDGVNAWSAANYREDELADAESASPAEVDMGAITSWITNDTDYFSAYQNITLGMGVLAKGAGSALAYSTADAGGPGLYSAVASDGMLNRVWSYPVTGIEGQAGADVESGDLLIGGTLSGTTGVHRLTVAGAVAWSRAETIWRRVAVDVSSRLHLHDTGKSGTPSEGVTTGTPACTALQEQCSPPLRPEGILRAVFTIGGTALSICLGRNWDAVNFRYYWSGQTPLPVEIGGCGSPMVVLVELHCVDDEWEVRFTIDGDTDSLPLEFDMFGAASFSGNIANTTCGTIAVVGDVTDCVDPDAPFEGCCVFDLIDLCCGGLLNLKAVGDLDPLGSECGLSCGGDETTGFGIDQTGAILIGGTTPLESLETTFDPDVPHMRFTLPFDDPGGLPGHFDDWFVVVWCDGSNLHACILSGSPANATYELAMTVVSTTCDPLEIVAESAVPAGLCCQDDIGKWTITITTA